MTIVLGMATAALGIITLGTSLANSLAEVFGRGGFLPDRKWIVALLVTAFLLSLVLTCLSATFEQLLG